jgi:hypothetical protein
MDDIIIQTTWSRILREFTFLSVLSLLVVARGEGMSFIYRMKTGEITTP